MSKTAILPCAPAECLTLLTSRAREGERFEKKFALAGEATDSDLDLYQRTSGNLRRLLEAVGLKRVPRDVTLDPLTYAREAAE